jgi:hypothetical protein
LFSPGVGAIIKAAKKDLEGDATIEKSAAAALKLAGLTKEASNVLLKVLAGTGWFG